MRAFRSSCDDGTFWYWRNCALLFRIEAKSPFRAAVAGDEVAAVVGGTVVGLTVVGLAVVAGVVALVVARWVVVVSRVVAGRVVDPSVVVVDRLAASRFCSVVGRAVVGG